jgi:hypothetical protein
VKFFLGDLKNVIIGCEPVNRQQSPLSSEQDGFVSHSFDHDDHGKKKTKDNNTMILSPRANDDQPDVTNEIRRHSIYYDNVLHEDDTNRVHHERLKSLSSSYQGILSSIGEDPLRPG